MNKEQSSQNVKYREQQVGAWDMRILQLEEDIFILQERLDNIKELRKSQYEKLQKTIEDEE